MNMQDAWEGKQKEILLPAGLIKEIERQKGGGEGNRKSGKSLKSVERMRKKEREEGERKIDR